MLIRSAVHSMLMLLLAAGVAQGSRCRLSGNISLRRFTPKP